MTWGNSLDWGKSREGMCELESPLTQLRIHSRAQSSTWSPPWIRSPSSSYSPTGKAPSTPGYLITSSQVRWALRSNQSERWRKDSFLRQWHVQWQEWQREGKKMNGTQPRESGTRWRPWPPEPNLPCAWGSRAVISQGSTEGWHPSGRPDSQVLTNQFFI